MSFTDICLFTIKHQSWLFPSFFCIVYLPAATAAQWLESLFAFRPLCVVWSCLKSSFNTFPARSLSEVANLQNNWANFSPKKSWAKSSRPSSVSFSCWSVRMPALWKRLCHTKWNWTLVPVRASQFLSTPTLWWMPVVWAAVKRRVVCRRGLTRFARLARGVHFPAASANRTLLSLCASVCEPLLVVFQLIGSLDWSSEIRGLLQQRNAHHIKVRSNGSRSELGLMVCSLGRQRWLPSC